MLDGQPVFKYHDPVHQCQRVALRKYGHAENQLRIHHLQHEIRESLNEVAHGQVNGLREDLLLRKVSAQEKQLNSLLET